MSPFTAVAVQYLDPGQTHRLGVGANGVAFEPAETMADVIAMTLDAGTFWVSPVAGSRPPIILGKNAEGDVEVSPGTPLQARTKIGSRDVLGVAATSSSSCRGRSRATSGCSTRTPPRE